LETRLEEDRMNRATRDGGGALGEPRLAECLSLAAEQPGQTLKSGTYRAARAAERIVVPGERHLDGALGAHLVEARAFLRGDCARGEPRREVEVPRCVVAALARVELEA